jgi:DNA-binding NarL/FixJ family response regulator
MVVIRVVVVDDQLLVRAGFRMILDGEPDIDVVAEAGDGQQAVQAVARYRPDVVLMDVRMPTMDGIEATREIVAAARAATDSRPSPRVIILTTFDVDEYVYEALRAGASGFLLKDTPPEDLATAVRVVAAGDALLAPSVTRRLIEDFARRPSPASSPGPERSLSSLTEREHEVLAQVARGLSNVEIAAALHVSETTVKTHVGRILMKLDLRDRVQAVVLAYESGLVVPGG